MPGGGGRLGAAMLCAQRMEALLTAEVSLDALVEGAFLWRVDHCDLQRMANASRSMIRGNDDDRNALRTPHVNVAVRAVRADSRRRFRLGEFVPYVLVCSDGGPT